MLLYYKASNSLSYPEIEFTMVAGNYRNQPHPENLVKPEKYNVNILKSAMIYGANASGKSNLLKSIAYSAWFIRKSFSTGTALPAYGNANLPDGESSPVSYQYGILANGTHFQYSFTVDQARILEEELIEYKSNKPIQHFHRKYNKDDKKYQWTFGRNFPGEKETVKNITNDRTLFLTIGSQTNLPVAEKVFKWFNEDLIWSIDSKSPGDVSIDDTLRRINDDLDFKKLVLNEVKIADFFIDDIVVEEENDRISRAYTLRRVIDGHGEERKVKFDLELEESVGTKRFIAWLGVWMDILTYGKVILIDEFSNSMHTLLSKHLVAKFHKSNLHGAQLIFTIHDTNLMTEELFRKDQIWIVERENDGNSNLYPLSDFKINAGKTIENAYLQGAYGGIPHIKSEN